MSTWYSVIYPIKMQDRLFPQQVCMQTYNPSAQLAERDGGEQSGAYAFESCASLDYPYWLAHPELKSRCEVWLNKACTESRGDLALDVWSTLTSNSWDDQRAVSCLIYTYLDTCLQAENHRLVLHRTSALSVNNSQTQENSYNWHLKLCESQPNIIVVPLPHEVFPLPLLGLLHLSREVEVLRQAYTTWRQLVGDEPPDRLHSFAAAVEWVDDIARVMSSSFD